MLKKISYGLVLLFIVSCAGNYKMSHSSIEPMFGGIEKTEKFKNLDEKFINTAINEFGTREKAELGYSEIAWNYLSVNDIDTSMRRFNQVWLLNENSANAFWGFSACLELKGKNGIEYLEKGKQLDKNNETETKYYELLSLIYPFYYGNSQKSMDCCNKLLEINPNNVFALQQRGHLFSAFEEWDSAIKDFENAENVETLSASSYNDYAYSLEKLEKFEKALILYNEATVADSQFLNPLYNSTMLLIRLEKYSEALKKINKCIDINPNEKEFHNLKKEIESKI